MHLAHPEWLWFLGVVPVLAALAWRAQVRRSRGWEALVQGGRPARDGVWLRLVGIVALSMAVAQPRWGQSRNAPLPPGRDVVLAIDVSRSMGVGDAVPDRLSVAVQSCLSLVSALGRVPGDRLAVVAFAGRGVLRCPLTENLGAAAEVLRSLRPGDVRPGETDLGSGLDAVLEAFDDQDHTGGRSAILLSDGEDHADRWKESSARLASAGVIVHTIAIGDDRQGHPVPSRPGADSAPLSYRGQIVLSRRSDAALQDIARETKGVFVPLGLTTTDLGQLYHSRIEPMARARRRTTRSAE
ncbi:MAG: VWA domain-containing protein [Isosphaeraceae bacterium]